MTVATVIHAAVLCVCERVKVMALEEQIDFFFLP